VHDIGKNIVGVVLQCNNYEVIDLGVMVPADKILEAAQERGCDIVGLSGLITPSLDEMVHVAVEMERRGMKQPLLIGGATTSKVHTALKIAPAFSQPVVHVLDASRAVGVGQSLLSPQLREDYTHGVREEYARIREERAARSGGAAALTLTVARAKGFTCDWATYTPPKPSFLGVRALDDYDLEELIERIDWTPFFLAWELKGRYPKILDDARLGAEARKLYDDGRQMLEQIVAGRWLKASGVFGFFPANRVGDDIELYTDDRRRKRLTLLHHLRQQTAREEQPNFCLADFVAPRASGVADYLGAFAVTVGHGADEKAREFEQAHDDYRAIMLKVLADRLAEAFAERLHERVRREFWGMRHRRSWRTSRSLPRTTRASGPLRDILPVLTTPRRACFGNCLKSNHARA
jgi:5-methyltetrahydrofolate--homocysteine methyltransferase